MIWGSQGAGTGPGQGAGSRIAIEAIGSAPRALPRRRRDPRLVEHNQRGGALTKYGTSACETARGCFSELLQLSVAANEPLPYAVCGETGTLWAAYAPSLAKDEA